TLGLTATCSPFGANKWRPEYAAFFRPQQRIVIQPDNDEPGQRHGQQVAGSLHGRVASLKILELPGVPDKGDVSDWLAAGGTREGLEILVDAEPEFVPVESEETGKMRFTRLGDLLNEPEEQIRWLLE